MTRLFDKSPRTGAWSWLLCVVLLGLILLLTPRVWQEWTVGRLLEEAARTQDPDRAIELLDQVRTMAQALPQVRVPVLAGYNNRALAFDRDGQSDRALDLFQRALSLDPGNALILQNFAVSLNNRAVELSRDREYQLSQDHFERATKLLTNIGPTAVHEQVRSNYSSLLTAWGQSLYREGRDDQARLAFNNALQLTSTNTVALLALGDLAYDANDFAKAQQLYKQGQSIAGSPADYLHARLDIIAGELAVNAILLSETDASGAFRVDIPAGIPESTRTNLLRSLTASASRVESLLGLTFQRPVNVRVFHARDFRRISRLPEWAMGSYDGKIRIKAEDLASADQTLRNLLSHELAHALIGMHIDGELPAWFHEGLAQYCESTTDAFGGRPDLDFRRLVAVLRAGGIVLSDRPTFRDITDHRQAEEAYLLSRHFVNYLARIGGENSIHKLLDKLKGSTSLDDAMKQVYGSTLGELETAWRNSILQQSAPLPRPAAGPQIQSR